MYTPKSVSFFQLQSWQEIVLLIKLLPYQHPLNISFFFFFLCIWLLVLFVFQTMVGSIPVHIRLAEQCWAIIIHRTPHLDSNPHLTLVMPYVSATWMFNFFWIAGLAPCQPKQPEIFTSYSNFFIWNCFPDWFRFLLQYSRLQWQPGRVEPEMDSQFKILGESLILSLQAGDLNSPISMH